MVTLSYLLSFAKAKPWTILKFLLLFAAVAGFGSYNWGLRIGMPLAAAITALSIAHRRIFDAASDAFFDINQDDAIGAKTVKAAATLSKRIFYSALDYGIAALSVGMVVALKSLGFSYLTAFFIMWLIIDIPSAAIFVAIYEKTGRDFTLGRSYRRMANVILSHSKTAGIVVFIYELTLASFWSGPDYTVMFFRDELKTRARLAATLISITALHAIIWTTVYWLGYENVIDLIAYLQKR